MTYAVHPVKNEHLFPFQAQPFVFAQSISLKLSQYYVYDFGFSFVIILHIFFDESHEQLLFV